MGAEFSRRLFLLAAPGAEGFTAFRPLWAGVRGEEASFADGNCLTREILLYCPPDAAISPGDVLFPPDSPSLSAPEWVILSVHPYSGYTEARAQAMSPPAPVL